MKKQMEAASFFIDYRNSENTAKLIEEESKTVGKVVQKMPLAFFNQICWSTLFTYTPELFPTRARGTGSGWAATIGRTGSIIAPTLAGFLLDVSMNASCA